MGYQIEYYPEKKSGRLRLAVFTCLFFLLYLFSFFIPYLTKQDLIPASLLYKQAEAVEALEALSLDLKNGISISDALQTFCSTFFVAPG